MSSDEADGSDMMWWCPSPQQEGAPSGSKACCTARETRGWRWGVRVGFRGSAISIWATGARRWKLYCGRRSRTAAPRPRGCSERPRGWGAGRRWCRGVWFGSFRSCCGWLTCPFAPSLWWRPRWMERKRTLKPNQVKGNRREIKKVKEQTSISCRGTGSSTCSSRWQGSEHIPPPAFWRQWTAAGRRGTPPRTRLSGNTEWQILLCPFLPHVVPAERPHRASADEPILSVCCGDSVNRKLEQPTSIPSSIPFVMRSSICFFSSHW